VILNVFTCVAPRTVRIVTPVRLSRNAVRRICGGPGARTNPDE
jgi:hypothetical protein